MTYTKDALKEAIQQKLRLNYGCTEKQATDGEIMKACALALRDIMAVRSVDTQEKTQEQQEKRVHNMSLEFVNAMINIKFKSSLQKKTRLQILTLNVPLLN